MTDEKHGIADPARLGAQLGADTEQEAREFEDVAAQLALAATPVEPPAELKSALFAKLGSLPQLPAEAPEPVAAGAPAPAAQPPVAPAPTAAERRAQRRWFQRPATLLAAAAAAVVLFVGGAFVGSTLAGTGSDQQQASALAAINAAPDVQRSSAAVTGGGKATLIWSAQLGKSALVATGLPPLPGDKTYELWYIRDGAATAAGTMNAGGSPATWRVLSGEMSAGDTVGVTIEPSGGSKRPTTAPIVAITS